MIDALGVNRLQTAEFFMHNYPPFAGKVCCCIVPSGEISGTRLFFLRVENRIDAFLSVMAHMSLIL